MAVGLQMPVRSGSPLTGSGVTLKASSGVVFVSRLRSRLRSQSRPANCLSSPDAEWYVAFFPNDMFLSRVGVFDTWMPRWLVEGARKLSIIVEILQVAGINYSVHVVVDINENVPVSPRRTRT